MLRFKQFLLFEDSIGMDSGGFDKRKRIVRPSPLTPDPAIRAFDLSQDHDPFAAFLDTENMTDQEVVDAFEKYKLGNKMPAMQRLQARLDNTAKEFFGDKLISEKAKEIRHALMQEKIRLANPNITIDDATKLRPKPIINLNSPERDFWWNFQLTPKQRTLLTKPDLRGVFQPEPSYIKNNYIVKEIKPSQSTVELMVRPSYPDLRDARYGPEFTPRRGSNVTSFADDAIAKVFIYPVKTALDTVTVLDLDNLDPASEFASQVLPRAASAAGLGPEVAMGAAMVPLAVGAFTQQAGDPMGDFKAGFAPGEFEKWQNEQDEARKRQNAFRVQSIIDRPYDPNEASSRRRQQ